MRRDCTGEPPGELIEMATAGASGYENAFCRSAAVDASDRRGWNWVPAAAIVPCNRRTGIVGFLERSDFGSRRETGFCTNGQSPVGAFHLGIRAESAIPP